MWEGKFTLPPPPPASPPSPNPQTLTTFGIGYLGSRDDEERSEMRYVMRNAACESSSLRTQLALRGNPGACSSQCQSPPSLPVNLGCPGQWSMRVFPCGYGTPPPFWGRVPHRTARQAMLYRRGSVRIRGPRVGWGGTPPPPHPALGPQPPPLDNFPVTITETVPGVVVQRSRAAINSPSARLTRLCFYGRGGRTLAPGPLTPSVPRHFPSCHCPEGAPPRAPRA